MRKEYISIYIFRWREKPREARLISSGWLSLPSSGPREDPSRPNPTGKRVGRAVPAVGVLCGGVLVCLRPDGRGVWGLFGFGFWLGGIWAGVFGVGGDDRWLGGRNHEYERLVEQ